MKLSIVIPLYYNEQNIPITYAKLQEDVFPHLPDYELILVDDGSKDNSYQEALKLREQDDKIKVIKLSRNFGQHVAIMAGYSASTGDCVLTIAADLQDPPSLIINMFSIWKSGNKVVFAIRNERKDGLLTNFFANVAYKVIKKCIPNIPKGGIGFSLIDSEVKDFLVLMNEHNSTVFYQTLWLGFDPVLISYERPEREIGKSSYSFSKKIKNLVDLILQFSYTPIRLISLFGVFSCLFSITYAIYIIFQKIFFGASSGWSSLMVAIMFTSGVQLLTLGVIGEYLWRNFESSRNRPLFIIDKKIGFDDK